MKFHSSSKLGLGLLAALAAAVPACAPGGSAISGGDDTGSLEDGVRVCAGAHTVPGLDVSVYNGTVDWTKVKASGQAFAIARVSDGLTHPDTQFAANWAGIKAVGLVRGVYQYFRASEDPAAQADYLVSKIGTLGAGDLAPIIDVETADGVSTSKVTTAVAAWIARIKSQTGVAPIIYTASGFWSTLPSTAQFAGESLWVANYGASCPSMPATWSKWSIWQSSESGSVPGVSGGIDVDEFNGTLSDLLAFASGAPAQPPPAGCATDADCNHGAPGVGVICSNSGSTAGQCIDGCHATSDCATGATCDTSQSPWACSNATAALGTACTSDATCSDGQPGTGRVCGSGDHTCIVGCHAATDCPSGTTCDEAGPAWYCAPSAPATLPLGAACTSDAQCGAAGQQRVCGSSSQVCATGCHADTDCPSGDTCLGTNQCGKAPPPPNACPVLAFPSGIHIQTVTNAAMTATYAPHLQAGQSAPTCFIDVTNLQDPIANMTYGLTVQVAANFQLTELVGTEVSQGWGNLVLLDPNAVAALQAFRTEIGGPVSVNSGFRGPKHQESTCEGLCGAISCAGTCSLYSEHMWGNAFDLPLSFYNTTDTNLACDAGFKFTYLEAGTHLHIDQNPAYATCVQE